MHCGALALGGFFGDFLDHWLGDLVGVIGVIGLADSVGNDRIWSVFLWRVAKDLNTGCIGYKHALFIKFIRLPIALFPPLAKRYPIQRQPSARLKQWRHGASHDHPDRHLLTQHIHSCR